MARVLLVLVAVAVVGGFAYGGARLAGWRPRRAAISERAGAADPDGYRNHLAMARLLEALLADEMVRPLIPAAEQERARRLLEEFYGEEA